MQRPAPDSLRIRSLNEFSVGQSHKIIFDVDEAVIERFADFSGDRNPLHMESATARRLGHPKQVAHGVITVAILSRLIGMDLPGPGALWMSQTVNWLAPVYPGDRIELEASIAKISDAASVLLLDVKATNQKGIVIMSGQSKVALAATPKGVAPGSASQRAALIIGGSRGIGAAITRKLAATGFKVAVNSRSSSGAELVGELSDEGHNACLALGDVSSPEGVRAAVSAAVERFGSIDVVVHCATPTIPPVDAADIRYEHIEGFLRTYLAATTALVAAVVPGMKDRKFGRLIFLGTSYLFGQPPAGMGAYIAGKSALWGFTRSLATELGPFGITANMVSPGLTSTELTGHISSRVKEVEARKSPARRLADPEDAANAVSMLASDGAGYINGVNLPLTGGPT